jgi:hypothetical protein
MTKIHFKFYKTLLSSDGHPFKVLQRCIDVQKCRSAERTLRAAQRRFERSYHGRNWNLFADEIEIDPLIACSSRSG